MNALIFTILQRKTNFVALSPQANYTEWSTVTFPRNLVPTFVDRGVSRGQRGGSPTVVNLSFLDRIYNPSHFEISITPLQPVIRSVMSSKYEMSLRSKRFRSTITFQLVYFTWKDCWGNGAGLVFLPWPDLVDILLYTHLITFCTKYLLKSCLIFLKQPSSSSIDWSCFSDKEEGNWLLCVHNNI
jgi:hypothetical protein